VSDPWGVVDLFAGAGGLSAGFSNVSTISGDPAYRIIRAVESDAAAAASFEANFGSADVFVGPIEEWLELEDADVVVGGPPCQGFSQLGRRDPTDPRNRLWEQYFRVVESIRPAAFVLENVDRFRASAELLEFRRRCAEAGYPQTHVAPLNAADFGTPQKRVRTIVVGIREGLPMIDPLPLPTHAQAPTFDDSAPWRTVADTLRGVSDGLPATTRLAGGRTVTVERFDGSTATIPGPYPTSELHIGRAPTERSLERYRHIGPGQNRHALPEHLQAPCWRKHKSGSADVMGRLSWDKPAVTVRTEFFKPEKGRYLHPSEHRALTHLEAALLQGFPLDYRWCGSKIEIARQIGNAVPVQLAEAVARSLYTALIATSEPSAA
jgi:DNA (cytosine-5)-methyltransferase 1